MKEQRLPTFEHAQRAIGERIAARREELGITQSELAKATGISRLTLTKVESGAGNPTVSTMSKLSDALGLPLWKLVYRAGLPPAPTVKAKAVSETVTPYDYLAPAHDAFAPPPSLPSFARSFGASDDFQ